MATKMTYSKAIATVLADETVVKVLGTEVVEKLTALKASVDKKSTAKGPHKPTKTQIANEGLKDKVYAVMSAEPDRLFTITELVKSMDTEVSNQKMSALVRQMYLGDSPKVVRIEDKRKAYFKVL